MKSISPELMQRRSQIDYLATLPESDRTALIEAMTIPERLALDEILADWHPLSHQLEPDGDWFIWLLQWGAGSGKTFTGAQLVRERIDSGTWRTVNVGGPTWVDTMRTMVQGTEAAPGLMGIWPRHQQPILRKSKEDPHLRCHNGAKIQLFGAQKAERFRGPAADGAWFDEVDAWEPEKMTRAEAFALAEQRIRTGPDPRIFCTTTPKQKRLVAKLRLRSDTTVTRATMLDNAVNLSPFYVKTQTEQYGGTRLGRQELDGELLPDVAGAIVSQEMIDDHRMTLEEFAGEEVERVVVGVDPFGGGGDACGIAAAARAGTKRAFVLADRTTKKGPDEWTRTAVELALEVGASCITYESNYGGDMPRTLLSHAMERLGVRIRITDVWASKSKPSRFEPVGMMYERGEVSHVGSFPQLEDEIAQFTPNTYEGDGSPNRADALVYAMLDLFPLRPGVTPGDLYGAASDDNTEEGARA